MYMRKRQLNRKLHVTNDLLKIDGVSVFDPVYEDYFWSYQNNGLKVSYS